MFSILSEFFSKKGIDLFAPIALAHCTVRKPYLLEREGIADGTAVIIAVPYLTKACLDPQRNVSAYAVSRDYHLFFEELRAELLPILRTAFPQERFAFFADHSPIAEVEAAARAGLGRIGKHHLLITERYSSYVFLGELITSMTLPCEPKPLESCANCGSCETRCPAMDGKSCLSALTQKKGSLTDAERAEILTYGSAWGCDICQQVCPHTAEAIRRETIFSPIPFFSQAALPHLTVALLDGMTDEEFSRRAYSWRGREAVRRNLLLLEKSTES